MEEINEKKVEALEEQLVKVVRDFAREEGGITFHELGWLLGDGDLYAALSRQEVIFCDLSAPQTQSGQEP